MLLLLLLASVTIQGSLSKIGGLDNFRPDLVLIVVVFWALKQGPAGGWFAGMGGGWLSDLFSAGMLGLGSLSRAVTGVMVVVSSHPLYRDHFSTKIVLVAAASVVSGFLYYLLLIVFSTPPPWPWAWREALWPPIWQTTLISPLWLWVAGKVLGK